MAVIASASKGAPVVSSSVTTDAIDTTGADLIVIATSVDNGSTQATPTDSKSNTWTALGNSASTVRVKLYYAWGSGIAVGSGHTFSYNASDSFPSIAVIAFSGALVASDPINLENGASSAGATSLQTGSVSPAGTDLFVTGIGWNAEAYVNFSINSAFTKQVGNDNVGGLAYGIAMAYKESGSAENPTWSRTNSDYMATRIASFKGAGGDGAALEWKQPESQPTAHYRRDAIMVWG
jgi:hypothetical protein